MEQVAPEAWFEGVSFGSRFWLRWRPPKDVPTRGAILYVHPFAEEMNKSRRMAALGARAFAADGWTVLQMDLHGCGDSGGDFGDATWSSWRADLLRACEVLRRGQDGEFWLWGLRAGALLISSLVESAQPVSLLFWNPVIEGKQHLTQFLRMKVMAERVQSGEGVSTNALREALAAGQAIEVAGYTLGPGLAAGLDAEILALPQGFAGRVVWLEVSSEPANVLSSGSQQRVRQWSDAGINVHAEALVGLPFWQTQEIAECATLVERSACLLVAQGV